MNEFILIVLVLMFLVLKWNKKLEFLKTRNWQLGILSILSVFFLYHLGVLVLEYFHSQSLNLKIFQMLLLLSAVLVMSIKHFRKKYQN
ncbi:hypothetical protein BPO_0968 [Bergeyella porcorum]|uniref:Uncharacterized protein n=1 Tax=Bergeyella porcorum TaxID=1735111 RepID=A0AAU0F0N6_9FLAO